MHIKALLKSTPTQTWGWSHDTWGEGKCARVSAGVSWRSKDRNAHLLCCCRRGKLVNKRWRFAPVQLLGVLVSRSSLLRVHGVDEVTSNIPLLNLELEVMGLAGSSTVASLSLFDHVVHPRLLSVCTRATLCLRTQDQARAKLWPMGQIMLFNPPCWTWRHINSKWVMKKLHFFHSESSQWRAIYRFKDFQ